RREPSATSIPMRSNYMAAIWQPRNLGSVSTRFRPKTLAGSEAIVNGCNKAFMSGESVENFLRRLKKSASGAVFNPWWQVDKQNDIGRNAPRIRRDQLRAYLCERFKKAQLAVIGEALGYRGGHFSGIPMTSERILLGQKKDGGIESEQVFSGITPRRTSKPQKSRDGFSEPTATIVWSTLLRLELSPEEFVLWNAFPWHSF